MHPTRDLAQIRYVTENYQQLQGLRWVPLGVALLLATPLYAGWEFTQSGVLLALWVLPVAVGLGLWWLVGRYYTRTFGHVQPIARPKRTWREETVVWALLLAAIVVPRGTGSDRLRLLLITLVVLAFIVFYLRRTGNLRLRPHWIVLPTVLAAVNLALLTPLPFLRPDHWPFHTLFAIWVASIGVGMIVGGLLDHLLLLHTIGSPVQDGHAQTV